MEICTIGFTKKSAAEFFGKLSEANIERLVDIRLNNVSQLAGFTKRNDLEFFLRKICGIGYVHEQALAPTQELLDRYKKGRHGWADYETRFVDLMAQRRIEDRFDRDYFAIRSVLLCSEQTPERCHRRLVVEYLADRLGDVTPVHL